MPLKNLKKSNIFCLEGDWNENLKHKSSILPALELLELNNSIQTIYRTIATKEEFNNRINKLLSNDTKYKSFDIIYLAFHGRTNKIILEDSTYTLDEIANEFENSFTNRIIHFGSCKTLAIDEAKANRFLKKTNALAISGYQSNVKFISSTVFDVLYFEICQQYKDIGSIRNKMKKHYGELVKELKFELYINKNK